VEAAIWQEEQKAGLGDEYMNEVMKCADKARANPLCYSIKTKEFREAIVKKLPYTDSV